MFCKRQITIPAIDIQEGDHIYYYSDKYSIVTQIDKNDTNNGFVKVKFTSKESYDENRVCFTIITKKFRPDALVTLFRNSWFCL